MFGFGNSGPHPLDLPIKALLDEMEMIGPTDEKFPKYVVQLDRLYEMKRNDTPKLKITGDTLAIVAGNILSVAMIIAFEQKGVWTTKSMNHTVKTNP